MIISITSISFGQEYDNIQVEQDEQGNKLLILTQDQFISLANYIEELETDVKTLEAKLAQAEIEIEKAYNDDKKGALDLSNLAVGGAVLASILVALSK